MIAGRRANIQSLVSNISHLAFSNRMTGLWDHLRGELCSGITKNQEYLEKIVLTERKSRFYVEERSLYRTNIDSQLKVIVEDYFQ
jgi:hypothetical protein